MNMKIHLFRSLVSEKLPLHHDGFCPQHCFEKPNLPVSLKAVECILGIQTATMKRTYGFTATIKFTANSRAHSNNRLDIFYPQT